MTRPWTQRPVHRWTPRVISFKRCSSDSNGYDADRTLRLKLTGRWNLSVRSSTVRVETWFSSTGRVRSTLTGHSQRPVVNPSHCTDSQRDQTQAVSVRCFWIQRSVTGPTLASALFSLLSSPPLLQCANHQEFASGAIENRHFIFPREGPKPISTLHTPCAHVLAYFHKYYQGC